MPTVKHAEVAEGQDPVRVTSELQNESRTQDGFFRHASPGERLEWGTDGDKDYHGFMEITETGQDQSRVFLHLHLNPPPQDAQEVEARSGQNFNSEMQEGVERCLHSIKQQVEGTGGKDEIPESR